MIGYKSESRHGVDSPVQGQREMRFTQRLIEGLDLVMVEGIAPADVQHAQAIRARRDALYSNIYEEEATDQRWVGDLGEICIAAWLDAERVPYEWLAGDKAAGLHDFALAGWRMGVKTVKRRVAVRSDYTAQVTRRHVHEPVDGFLFLTYHEPNNAMYLLGAIGRKRFLQEAVYYGPGEWVHANYQVREGHEIYNVEILKLTSPLLWLGMVRDRLEHKSSLKEDRGGSESI